LKRNFASAMAVTLAFAATAHAQTKQELVRKVIELQKPAYQNIARSVAREPAMQVSRMASQAMRQVPQDKRESLAKAITADLQKYYAEVEPVLRERAIALAPATLAPLLEERFNEDELKQIIAWLESPVARKYQDASPELGNALTRKLVADTRPTIEPKLKTLQESLNKRLSAAASPASAPSGPASK
jgi:hypothetical protein